MPELPEVETTRRGLEPLLAARRIQDIAVHNPRLRQAVDIPALHALRGATFTHGERRGKYLWLHTDRAQQSLLIHLGMSGSLRVNPPEQARKTHDHIEIFLDNRHILRLHDPRRFGMMQCADPTHPPEYLQKLGVEPLDDAFHATYLHERLHARKSAVKICLMDQSLVVGVGNIYASEALFLAGIRPTRAAQSISLPESAAIVENVKKILAHAIAVGGTTLRDFVHSDGRPGYFQQTLNVYGRHNLPCPRCQTPLCSDIIGGRSTVWCAHCQQ